jgi:hypothetical protein
MNGDDFVNFLREAIPKAEIADARLSALIDASLRQARQTPQRRGWSAWLSWPRLAPVMQFALPMVVAAVLGISVSSRYVNDLPVAQFSSVMLSTTLMPAGS